MKYISDSPHFPTKNFSTYFKQDYVCFKQDYQQASNKNKENTKHLIITFSAT